MSDWDEWLTYSVAFSASLIATVHVTFANRWTSASLAGQGKESQPASQVSEAIRPKQVNMLALTVKCDHLLNVCLSVRVCLCVPSGTVALSPAVQCHVSDAISADCEYLLIGAHKSVPADRLHCRANVRRQLMVSTVRRLHGEAVIKCRLGN